MATRYSLMPLAAEQPSANYAPVTVIHSTEQIPVLAFDATTAESAFWTFVAPQGLTGTLSLLIFYCMASATSGGVAFDVAVQSVTPGDALDLDAATGYDTANTGTDAAVPGTAGYMETVSVTLTNADSMAAGDLVRIKVTRAVANAADTATGDLYLLAAEFRDGA